jgi:hypothetical protein
MHTKFCSGNVKERGPLGRPSHAWEYNITMELKETGCEGVCWIHLALESSSEHGSEYLLSIKGGKFLK